MAVCFAAACLGGGADPSNIRNVKTVLKRDLEMHQGKLIELISSVTDADIQYVNSTGTECHLQYPDVKKVVQTKEYIYLWSKANMLYSIKKDSFSVGTSEGFLDFLRSKNIKVK